MVGSSPSRLKNISRASKPSFLEGMRCVACGALSQRLTPRCVACGSSETLAHKLPLLGRVVARTRVERTHDWWPGPSPYDLAEVRLDETDVYIVAAVIDGVEVGVGDLVEMIFLDYQLPERVVSTYHWRPVTN